jgi:hypothetical protein
MMIEIIHTLPLQLRRLFYIDLWKSQDQSILLYRKVRLLHRPTVGKKISPHPNVILFSPMKEVVVVHYSELGTKGGNRRVFERKFADDVRRRLGPLALKVRLDSARVLVEVAPGKDRWRSGGFWIRYSAWRGTPLDIWFPGPPKTMG